MAEVAVVVHSRSQLAERLAAWDGAGIETTWALVFVGAIPSAGELAAAREAAKLCDKVVGVTWLGTKGKVAPKFAEVCRSAGIDLVWVAKDTSGFAKVDLGVSSVEGTFVAQAVVTTMPMLVVAHRTEVALIRALRNFLGGLGDVFSLRLVG